MRLPEARAAAGLGWRELQRACLGVIHVDATPYRLPAQRPNPAYPLRTLPCSRVMPDRSFLTMEMPFMRAYTQVGALRGGGVLCW